MIRDASSIMQRQYSVSPAIQKYICEELKPMLSLGVIEETQSPWSSPVVLVSKPGKNRFLLDSRKVNSVTVKNAYPLPRLEGMLSRLQETSFIFRIDFKDAFWQVPLEKLSRTRTAVTIYSNALWPLQSSTKNAKING